MTRALPCLLALVLAGCLSEGTPAAEPPAADNAVPPQDSEPRHEVHDLTSGIQRTWWFHVASPGGPAAVLRFALEGPETGPPAGGVCLTYALEQHVDGGVRETKGERGDCANGLTVSVEPGLGEILFELRGADVRPGTYRFDANGGPQAGSLAVDLAAR